MREYTNLKMQTADGNSKTISPGTYAIFTEKTSKILKFFSPEAKHAPPLNKLLEIEKNIEIADASITNWQTSDD